MRRWLTFDVEGAACAATLDDAAGTTGLLIVSGGNEVRSGAHRGMAAIAASIAAEGFPVLRFDRRGIGDSEGENHGFESSAADIAAALVLFRAACPALRTIVAFGNCDAASALILHSGGEADLRLLLANPWIIEPSDSDNVAAAPPPAQIRARYAARLRDPGQWLRVVRGDVDFRKLWRGLRAAAAPAAPSMLADTVFVTLGREERPVRLLIAEGDGTAQVFSAEWAGARHAALRAKANIAVAQHPTGSHSFADADASVWLSDQILAMLRG